MQNFGWEVRKINYSEDTGVDGRIILKQVLWKKDDRLWIELIWFL
jgi:hypothetical protein